MPGLFVQRQAEAVSAFCEVAVLYAHPVPGASNKFEIDISLEKNIQVIRVYYKVPEKQIPDFSGHIYLGLGCSGSSDLISCIFTY